MNRVSANFADVGYMARQLRSFIAGETYHVYNRGNNRMDVFMEDIDREVFLDLLKRATRCGGVSIHAMVLMTTHFHVLGTAHSECSMPLAMKSVEEQYAWFFNRNTRAPVTCGSTATMRGGWKTNDRR